MQQIVEGNTELAKAIWLSELYPHIFPIQLINYTNFCIILWSAHSGNVVALERYVTFTERSFKLPQHIRDWLMCTQPYHEYYIYKQKFIRSIVLLYNSYLQVSVSAIRVPYTYIYSILPSPIEDYIHIMQIYIVGLHRYMYLSAGI